MATADYLSGIALRLPYPPSSSSMLCQLCRAFGDWFITNWISIEQPHLRSIQHHLSWDTLAASAVKGCTFCYQLALEGEERAISRTILHKLQNGKPTAFTAEMDGEGAKISIRCDRLEWCLLDVYAMPGKLGGVSCE